MALFTYIHGTIKGTYFSRLEVWCILIWKHINILLCSNFLVFIIIFIFYVKVKFTKSSTYFLHVQWNLYLVKMPPKLKSKIVVESQGLGSDIVETVQKGIVSAMVKQMERNLANPQIIQDDDVSNNPIGQEEV